MINFEQKSPDEDFLIAAELAAMNGYPYEPKSLPEIYKHLSHDVERLNELHKNCKINLSY